ncbi:tetratricopeptide repeat protein [Archangium violaceum]|uniref:tetratricopeptide repeat protein n=1 Tax=Archangium violaceum TaxID=83451 RepID=UPI002B313018|nr:tetratricopeptide repeat protein [Archangium gephyra]
MITFLALASATGQTQPVDRETIASSEASCQRGMADHCVALAALFAEGTSVPQDLSRADSFARRGCELGSARGCELRQKLDVLGQKSDKLQAAQKKLAANMAEHQRNVAHYAALCDEGQLTGCYLVAYLSAQFVDEKTAEARINLYLDKASARDAYGACIGSMALYMDTPPAFQQMLTSFHTVERTCGKACDAKDWKACAVLGEEYAQGKLVPKDPVRAATLSSRACDGGILLACGNLGLAYLRNGTPMSDVPRMLSLLERGCGGEHPGACHALGVLYRKGNGVPRDTDKALQFLQRSCRLHTSSACDSAEALLREPQAGGAPAPRPEGGVKKTAILDSLQLDESVKKTPILDSLRLDESVKKAPILDSLRLDDGVKETSGDAAHPRQ